MQTLTPYPSSEKYQTAQKYNLTPTGNEHHKDYLWVKTVQCFIQS